MRKIIARSVMGGRDLYFGVPNLTDAQLENVSHEETGDDYITNIQFRLANGKDFVISIRQGRVD